MSHLSSGGEAVHSCRGFFRSVILSKSTLMFFRSFLQSLTNERGQGFPWQVADSRRQV